MKKRKIVISCFFISFCLVKPFVEANPIDEIYDQISQVQHDASFEGLLKQEKQDQKLLLKLLNEILQATYEDIHIVKIERIAEDCISLNDYGMISENSLEQVFKSLQEKLNENKNFLNFVVFNETFFCKKMPLMKETFERLESQIKDISLRNKNAVIYVNFLKQEKETLPKEKILQIYTKTAKYKQEGSFVVNDMFNLDKIMGSYLESIKALVAENKEQEINVLSNFNKSYYGGQEMTCYYKTSYYTEVEDEFLKQDKFIYMMGDGKDHDIAKTPLSSALLRYVSTQICSDVLRQTRGVEFIENEDGFKSIYHIIVSNTIALPCPMFSMMVPSEKIIINVDSYDSFPGLFYRAFKTLYYLRQNGEYFCASLLKCRDSYEDDAKKARGENVIKPISSNEKIIFEEQDLSYAYKITDIKMGLNEK
ncbi:MAG: hypothetical protein ACLRFH_00130 [Opitutales bacterium]